MEEDTRVMLLQAKLLPANHQKPQEREKSLSHVRLFVTPGTVVHQAPPSMGLSRQEYWNAISFSRGSSQTRDGTQVSHRVTVLRRNQLNQHLHLTLQASRTVRQYISTVPLWRRKESGDAGGRVILWAVTSEWPPRHTKSYAYLRRPLWDDSSVGRTPSFFPPGMEGT